ncbi:MAG: hypothetical protein JWO33_1207 [Caulobacteraceae bacterium]|nr:hypothetical protein [Caulobacteraceae bacterium]
MFKRVAIALVASAGLAAFSAPALAQNWMPIDQRQNMLDQRIDAGIRSGQLTPPEAVRLRGEFRDIASLEARYRAGGLSDWERRDLDRRFDALSAQIRMERRDQQAMDRGDRGMHRGWFGGRDWMDRGGVWTPVNMRQRELDRRIDTGIRTGRLTTEEAARLRAEFRDVSRLERTYRRGGLTGAERAELDRRFDRLAARITWESNDRQMGSGYGYRR